MVAGILDKAKRWLLRLARHLRLIGPRRVAFDSNVISGFEGADPAVRQAILRCVESGTLRLYTSELVLRELMGLAGTNGEAVLPALAGTVLEMINGRILASPQGLLESELNGKPIVAIELAARNHLITYLKLTAAGKIQASATDIGKQALAEKQRALEELRKYAPILDDRPAGLTDSEWSSLRRKRTQQLKSITFEAVRDSYVAKHGKTLLVMNYQAWGVASPDARADEVLQSLHEYPRHAVWIASHAIPAYAFRALGRAPRDGDLFDHRQLVYGVDMDVFVTDDRRLREWFAMLYGKRLRVMTVAEFLAERWC